jgi:hypothetical protein
MTKSSNTWGPERLLAEDHEALGELLRVLLTRLDEGDAAAAFPHLDLFWARLAMHIRAENLHLFPAILNAPALDAKGCEGATLSPEEARGAIARLRSDHDFFMHELARAVSTVRELMASPGDETKTERLPGVRQIISAVSVRLEAHNVLEEEQVYRLPASLLTSAEQSALAARMRREIENLPPRFK